MNKYRIIEETQFNGYRKYFPQVLKKDFLLGFIGLELWNYYRSGIDDNLSFKTMQEAKDFIYKVENKRVKNIDIYYL